ncbi:MAG: phosphate uptake regulator PhoU [Verrucomicrobia bacterium]|nr:phosphate uptake regulator PhoU [Verrucomicrobiota bacterium]
MAFEDRRHTLPKFDAALEDIRATVLLMGTLVRRNLQNVSDGFSKRDDDSCAAVIADNEEVEILQKQIDRDGTNILVRFQPMLFDLRSVIATIKVASHLELLSDHTVLIARHVQSINDCEYLEKSSDLKPLFRDCLSTFSETMQAFAEADATAAGNVQNQTGTILKQTIELGNSLTGLVEKQILFARCLISLITVAQSLNRIASCIRNIAEETIYVAEARDVRYSQNRYKDVL